MSELNLDPTEPVKISFQSDVELDIEEINTILNNDTINDRIEEESRDISFIKQQNIIKNNTNDIQSVLYRKNKVSGLYSVTKNSWILDLRIDVDGKRPMMKVSGDFYSVRGETITYFGSFRIDSINLKIHRGIIKIEGTAETTWTSSYNKTKIFIPQSSQIQHRSPATIEWYNSAGQKGASYVCPFLSKYFRRILHEMDFEEGIIPFEKYVTGLLPSGGVSRELSITLAYREAGIDFPQVVGNNIVSSEAGEDNVWTDAELHASMVRHFGLYRDIPQWSVWSISCKTEHELGPDLYGIMFDQEGKERQGCAVFYGGVGGTSPDKLRLQLYTHVHELGHCFNLLHSWQKNFAIPPAPNNLSSLSWMNYPWRFPGGPDLFWNQFSFQFDDSEIIHLRHAFRDDIILGGNPFTRGSALDSQMKHIQQFENPIRDNSGLDLKLESKKRLHRYGEPVVIDIKLYSAVKFDKLVHTELHPKYGFIKIGIRKPSGVFVMYEPLMDYLKLPHTTILNNLNPSIYESAYIGYGKDLYFDQIGEYMVRAIYYSLDGSEVYSNTLRIKVGNPLSKDDEEVADLLMGDEQGKLFYLLGSSSPALIKGNNAFDEVQNEYEKHPLSVYVEFVKGINASRPFRIIEENSIKEIKKSNPDESIAFLSQVKEKTIHNKGLDNISGNYAIRKLAQQYLVKKDIKSTKQILEEMLKYFEEKDLKPHVIEHIKTQIKELVPSKSNK